MAPRVGKHVCMEITYCTCNPIYLEPYERCRVHDIGEYPYKCHFCGKFTGKDQYMDWDEYVKSFGNPYETMDGNINKNKDFSKTSSCVDDR